MTYTVEVKNNGRVQLPKELRDALNLTEGSKLAIEPEKDFIKVMTIEQKLASIRKVLNRNPAWKEFSVDEFIRERREEARREMAELTHRDNG